MKSLPGKLGTLALLTAVASSLAASCSSSVVPDEGGAPDGTPSAKKGSEGSLGLSLVPVAGIEINSVNYVVTGTPAIPGTPLPSGTLPTPGTASSFSFGIPVPVGTGYTLSLTAASADPDDDITCSGSYSGPVPPGTGFSVTANTTTSFTMVLTCVDNTNGQLVAGVNVVTDACPRLLPTWVSAIPNAANVGESIAVSALGSDLDGATIEYSWSIPGSPASTGSFAAPGSQSTSFTCGGARDNFIVRVTMDNGDCTKDLDTIISCTLDTCPNGQLDPNEDCDPDAPVGQPGHNPFGCPNDCTVECGDGDLEPPTEECEIGVGGMENGVCTAQCRNRPVLCNDGWLTPPEVCDPSVPSSGPCKPDCTPQTPVACGNGVLEGAEVCDGSPTAFYSTDPRGCNENCNSFIFSSECQTCINNGCAGADTCQGGGFTAAQSATCNELLNCVDDSGCNSGGFPLFCYCGATTATQCDNGQGTGACRALIEQGLNSTDPGFIQNNLFDIGLPGGRAMARFECGNGAGCATLCQ
ncbi:MAG TPA: hypothetical protein VJN18_24940 [Polyangiaceae bacterium]|nr:hypothetical protein [Polyangiaceae bacterium]